MALLLGFKGVEARLGAASKKDVAEAEDIVVLFLSAPHTLAEVSTSLLFSLSPAQSLEVSASLPLEEARDEDEP